MAKDLSFFNNYDNNDDMNIIITHRNIKLSFLDDKKVIIKKDKNENLIIIVLDNQLDNLNNNYDEIIKKSQELNNTLILRKELNSCFIGPEENIINNIHIVTSLYLTQSIYKSHSLFSFLGIQSPYLIYPSSLKLKFKPNEGNQYNDYMIELGGGESRYGSYWIDSSVENVPILNGSLFSMEDKNLINRAFLSRRLTKYEVKNEFPEIM